MKRKMYVGLGLIFLSQLFLLGSAFAATRPLEAFPQPEFVETPFGDGDSFMVKSGEKSEVFRLYYVDCVETSVSTESDQRRVREQARYFGVDPVKNVLAFGHGAKERTRELLQGQKFTLHTAWARALGRSGKPRYYAFVTLEDGSDLGARLVAEGYARAKGTKRSTPDGLYHLDHQALLEDLELFAAISRKGVWGASDPGRIVAMRKEQREESRELKGLMMGTQSIISEDHPLNINEASMEELQQIQGIGPTLAERIIDGRPFTRVAEIDRVKGIGPSILEDAAKFMTVVTRK